MTLEVVVPIVLAVAGGLGWLAFNRPHIYLAVFGRLVIFDLAVFWIIFVWSMSSNITFHYVHSFIETSKYDAAEAAALSLQIFMPWTVVGCGVSGFYLLVLRWFIELEKKKPNGGSH